ncbi:MAG: glycosyltransferase family 4 protein [Parcubacteria group bacterium]|nr:glycosyltransferase family 4 protein [Parcubacteria group bacterium]
MKIIQANKFYFQKGGAEKYMLDLSSWLETQGHEVIPFAMAHPDSIQTPYKTFFPSFVHTEKTSLGWQGMRTMGRMLYSGEAKRKMRKLIKATKPDICHVHNIYTQLSPSILSALQARNVPVVMTVHDHHLISPQYNIWASGCGEDYRNVGFFGAMRSRFHKGSALASLAQTATFKFHKMLGLYRNNVDVFICPSQYMKRQLVHGGFPQEKLRVVPYGIESHHIEPRYDHDWYFLYVGRLSEEKGVDTIIRAAKILDDVPLKIVGTGPQSAWLHKLAHGHENIEFLGYRSGKELDDLYRGATALLLPSRVHENAPLVALEAMSHGTPVIASDVGGVSEMVLDRQTGILVDPADLDAWTEAMLRTYHDSEFTQQMATGARERVARSFLLERHYQEVINIYNELI